MSRKGAIFELGPRFVRLPIALQGALKKGNASLKKTFLFFADVYKIAV